MHPNIFTSTIGSAYTKENGIVLWLRIGGVFQGQSKPGVAGPVNTFVPRTME